MYSSLPFPPPPDDERTQVLSCQFSCSVLTQSVILLKMEMSSFVTNALWVGSCLFSITGHWALRISQQLLRSGMCLFSFKPFRRTRRCLVLRKKWERGRDQPQDSGEPRNLPQGLALLPDFSNFSFLICGMGDIRTPTSPGYWPHLYITKPRVWSVESPQRWWLTHNDSH